MTPRRIHDALEVVTWLGEFAGQLPEEQKKGVQMQLTFAVTGLYLAEYMYHTGRAGLDAYDALLKTARGDLAWPEISSLWDTSLLDSIHSSRAKGSCP